MFSAAGTMSQRVDADEFSYVCLMDNGSMIVRPMSLLVSETGIDVPEIVQAKAACGDTFATMQDGDSWKPMADEQDANSRVDTHVTPSSRDASEDQAQALLRSLFANEWLNLCERVKRRGDSEDPLPDDALREWASDRGQVLSRTVRGVMLYGDALRVLAQPVDAHDEDGDAHEVEDRGALGHRHVHVLEHARGTMQVRLVRLGVDPGLQVRLHVGWTRAGAGLGPRLGPRLGPGSGLGPGFARHARAKRCLALVLVVVGRDDHDAVLLG